MIKTYLVEITKDLKINLFWKKEVYKKGKRLLVLKKEYLILIKYWAELITEKTFTEKDVKVEKKKK
jgi:hypothetical protein